MRRHIASLLDRHEIIYRPTTRKAIALLAAREVHFPPIELDPIGGTMGGWI